MFAYWQRAVNRLVVLDRRWHYTLSRLAGVLFLATFLASLFAILYLWFRLMQPYAE